MRWARASTRRSARSDILERILHPRPSVSGTKRAMLSCFVSLGILWACRRMDEARMTRHNKTRSRATNTPSASLPLRDAFASQRIAALFLSWNDIIVLAPRRFILIQSGTSADLCGIARGRAERLGPGATEQMYLAFIVVMRAALRSRSDGDVWRSACRGYMETQGNVTHRYHQNSE